MLGSILEIEHNRIVLDYMCLHCRGAGKIGEGYNGKIDVKIGDECPYCSGVGFILTEQGNIVIEFLNRHVL